MSYSHKSWHHWHETSARTSSSSSPSSSPTTTPTPPLRPKRKKNHLSFLSWNETNTFRGWSLKDSLNKSFFSIVSLLPTINFSIWGRSFIRLFVWLCFVLNVFPWKPFSSFARRYCRPSGHAMTWHDMSLNGMAWHSMAWHAKANFFTIAPN